MGGRLKLGGNFLNNIFEAVHLCMEDEMNRYILRNKVMWICILFMAIPFAVFSQEAISINMDTVDGEWSIGVDLEGKLEVDEYTIDIYVKSVRFIASKKYKYDKTIESISFGLSKNLKKGSKKWDIYENSNVMKVKKTMKPGEEFELNDLTFRIPVQDFWDIQYKWLTFQIKELTIEKKGKKETPGYVYAHSEEDIFQ